MKSGFFLVRIQLGIIVSKFSLYFGQTTIGRSLRSDICLPDSSVSRRHAEILVSNSGVTIRDLKSRNGTFVDGGLIATCVAKPGQEVRFGAITLLLSSEESLSDVAGLEPDTSDERVTKMSDTKSRVALSPGGAAIRLRPSEQRVFDLLVTGLTEQQVADALGISHTTVHNHASAIYRAFGVHSRPQLLAKALPRPSGVEATAVIDANTER